MHVGIVTQAYYPVLGGVTEHVWHLGKELERRGHTVTVITGGVPHRLMINHQTDDRGLRVLRHGVQIPLMSNGANIYVTVGWKLGRILQRIESEEKFDVVHIMSPLDPGLPIIASKAMKTPKVGTYHTARDQTKDWREAVARTFRPVYLDAIKKIQQHIAVSPSAAEFVHHYFPDVKLAIVPNGIDAERFSPTVPPISKFADDVFTILFVGRMDPRKGAKILFQALPTLEAHLKNYRVVVVGTGWMQKYYDAHVPLNLRNRISFTGYASPDDLPSYYKTADVYCSPATGNESFGIVLLEAMACGTPVVASDIEGYRGVMTSGQEGLLVPPRDPQVLAQALISLAKDPERRQQMGQTGRIKALEYTWSAIVDRLLPIYESARKG